MGRYDTHHEHANRLHMHCRLTYLASMTSSLTPSSADPIMLIVRACLRACVCADICPCESQQIQQDREMHSPVCVCVRACMRVDLCRHLHVSLSRTSRTEKCLHLMWAEGHQSGPRWSSSCRLHSCLQLTPIPHPDFPPASARHAHLPVLPPCCGCMTQQDV